MFRENYHDYYKMSQDKKLLHQIKDLGWER